MVASFSGSASSEGANSLKALESSMDESAKQSIERWRLRLAGTLNALAKNLGEPL
jgi:hypothetical protein